MPVHQGNINEAQEPILDNNTHGLSILIHLHMILTVPTLIYLYVVEFKVENMWELMFDELKWVVIGILLLIILKICVSKIPHFWTRNWTSFVIGSSLLTFLSISAQILEWYNGYNEISAIHFIAHLILADVIYYAFLDSPSQIYNFLYGEDYFCTPFLIDMVTNVFIVLLVRAWDTPGFWLYHLYHNTFIASILFDLSFLLEGDYYIFMGNVYIGKGEVEKV